MKTGKDSPTRAFIYIRQSKAKDDSISEDVQRDACKSYAERKGYEVVGSASDIGRSGLLSADKRPKLRDALAVIADKGADVLIVWRWSRLSRRTYDQAVLMQKIEDAGGRVESAMEQMEPGAAGEFSRDMLLAMAAFESKQKSESWREAHKERIEDGLPPSGTKYFGYIKYQDKYEIHEEMAQHLREAYEMFIDGKSIYAIAQMLNDVGAHEQITVLPGNEKKGIPPQTVVEQREPWSAGRVLAVLDYDYYRGKIKYKGELHDGSHKPLLKEAKWQAYKAARGRTAMIPPAAKGNRYWLAGLVRCGRCGGAMAKFENKSGKYLRCRAQAATRSMSCPGVRCRQDHVEWAVWVWLLDHLNDLANQLPSDDEAKRAADEAIVTTRQEMEAASKAITNLQLMAVRMSWNDSQIRGAMGELEPELTRATTAHEEALAKQGEYRPITDVWERLQRGLELRHKLEMSQPVYDREGNTIDSQTMLFQEDGETFDLEERPEPKPILDKDNPKRIIGYRTEADPAFQAEVTASFAADLRRIIKSITVSPDFPDKAGRLRKGETRPVRLERYKIEAA